MSSILQPIPLEEISSLNSAFSEKIPGLQLFWDSTSYSNFKTCPFYYYLTNIQGLRLRGRSPDLTFGIAWHSAIERYHRLRASSLSHEDALFWTISETYYRQLLTPKEVAQGYSFHEEGIPFGKPAKTPAILLRALIAYLDLYGDNDNLFTVILPSGKPAVELSFSFPVGHTFSWSGHLDRVVSKNEPIDLSRDDPTAALFYDTDYKTTTSPLNARYWEQWTPDIQMTGYTIASKVILSVPAKGVIIDAASLSVTGQDFARNTVPRTPAQLDEFLSDLLLDLQVAEFYAKNESWPQNPKACFRYGRFCEFHEACSHAPHVRPNILSSSCERVFWNPRKER